MHAYLCGHDHINEHLQADGVEYFIAGASTMSGTLTDDYSSYASVAWAGESYSAFARFTATRDDLIIDYVSTNNETVYTYAMYNPNTEPSAFPTSSPTSAPSSSPSGVPSGQPTSAPSVESTLSFCDKYGSVYTQLCASVSNDDYSSSSYSSYVSAANSTYEDTTPGADGSDRWVMALIHDLLVLKRLFLLVTRA